MPAWTACVHFAAIYDARNALENGLREAFLPVVDTKLSKETIGFIEMIKSFSQKRMYDVKSRSLVHPSLRPSHAFLDGNVQDASGSSEGPMKSNFKYYLANLSTMFTFLSY